MKKVILAIFGVIFTSLLFSQNSFAVSDITYTLDSSYNPSDIPLCGSDLGLSVNCSDYKYLIVDTNDSTCKPSYPRSYMPVEVNGTTTGLQLCFTPYVILEIDDVFGTWVRTDAIQNYTGFETGWSVTVTLTDSLPGGGSTPTPEPEPCPDPEENSQYINVVLDSFWKYHKAFAGAVVAIIVIFLVYRLIKGVMR